MTVNSPNSPIFSPSLAWPDRFFHHHKEKRKRRSDHQRLPYSGKVWRAGCLANLLFLSVWRKKVWRMNRSAKRLSMVAINLDGFSLANRLRFAKFAKPSPRQTFPLYGNFLSPYTCVRTLNVFTKDTICMLPKFLHF